MKIDFNRHCTVLAVLCRNIGKTEFSFRVFDLLNPKNITFFHLNIEDYFKNSLNDAIFYWMNDLVVLVTKYLTDKEVKTINIIPAYITKKLNAPHINLWKEENFLAKVKSSDIYPSPNGITLLVACLDGIFT